MYLFVLAPGYSDMFMGIVCDKNQPSDLIDGVNVGDFEIVGKEHHDDFLTGW